MKNTSKQKTYPTFKTAIMIEKHPFGYYLPKNADKLILGSFPCFNGQDYGEWFYSGSGKYYFWQLLGEAFNLPTEGLENKMKICDTYGIAITDIAFRIERFNGSCSDSKIKIIEMNSDAIRLCLAAGITKVFFTSRFVQKKFFSYFPDFDLEFITLPSPSPAANRYLVRLSEFKELIKANKLKDSYEYRLMKYREELIR